MAFFLLWITMYRPTRHRQELPPSLTDTLTLPHLNTDKTEEGSDGFPSGRKAAEV